MFFPLGAKSLAMSCICQSLPTIFPAADSRKRSDRKLLRGSFWRSQLHGADCKGLGRFRTSSCIGFLATAGLVQRWSVGQDEHEDMWTYGDFWIHMDHVGFDVWNPLPGKTWATWDWDKSCYTHVADHLPASWKLTFSYHMLSLDTWSRPSKKLWFVGTHCHKSPWILPFDLKNEPAFFWDEVECHCCTRDFGRGFGSSTCCWFRRTGNSVEAWRDQKYFFISCNPVRNHIKREGVVSFCWGDPC